MIINCLIIDDEPVAREILGEYVAREKKLRLAGSCKNALDAFEKISSESIGLVFLDINMPGINGLSFARSINKNIKVIFTTAYREYAVDGFDLQAVDYLLKPISYERFRQAVDKYLNESQVFERYSNEVVAEEKNDFIFVRSDRKMIKIVFSQIRYIESIGDYVKIHLDDKTIVIRETISNIEAQLPQKDFIRTHRSYIVSFRAIESFTNEYVETGKHQIPISRSYKNDVLGRLDIERG